MARRIPLMSRRSRSSASSSTAMRGISLIEVLVSVLVLGVGLLGIGAMQAMALRTGQSSMESTQAVMQTTGIIEAMRANRANAAAYNTAGMLCAATGGVGLVGNDLDSWVTSLQDGLGGGGTTCGQIAGCPDACVITVRWNDQRAGGSATRDMVTEARI